MEFKSICQQMNIQLHEWYGKKSDSEDIENHTLKLHQALELQPWLGTGPVYNHHKKEII